MPMTWDDLLEQLPDPDECCADDMWRFAHDLVALATDDPDCTGDHLTMFAMGFLSGCTWATKMEMENRVQELGQKIIQITSEWSAHGIIGEQ